MTDLNVAWHVATNMTWLVADSEDVFQLSRHAQRRIRQRQIPAECLYNAVYHGCRRRRNKQRNREIRFDRRSRWAVVVDPLDRIVVTAFRLNKKQVRFLNESAKRG